MFSNALHKQNGDRTEKKAMWKGGDVKAQGSTVAAKANHIKNDPVTLTETENGVTTTQKLRVEKSQKIGGTDTFQYQLRLDQEGEVKLYKEGKWFAYDKLKARDP